MERLFKLTSFQPLILLPIFVVVTDIDTYQWHLHLGRASLSKLRNLILVVTLNNCKLAKQSTLSFPTYDSL